MRSMLCFASSSQSPVQRPKLGGRWREYPGAALSADCSDSSDVGAVAVVDGSGSCLACGLELQPGKLRSPTTTAFET